MAVLASNFFFGDRERDLPTRDVRYTPKCRGVGGDHHPRIFLYERRATPGLGQAGELSSQISEKKETQPTHIKKRRIIQRFFLETRPFEVHAFYVYLSCFMTRHTRWWERWWSCQLIDPSGWGVGGMAGHAGPRGGPASDVVLPLHSLKKRGAT